MREQVLDRAERLAHATEDSCAALAVVSGDGMANMFRSLGATPLDGGPTLNPSTYELLAGIHSVPAEEVVVLPNSPNVRMAAERAADLSDKTVFVVPSRSQQAGLAAAVALDANRSAKTNAAAMCEALDAIRTGAVTEAARDDGEQRFRAGEAIGFIDEELVAWGNPEETLRKVLDSLSIDAELLTLIAGPSAPLGPEQVGALIPDGMEFELSDGAQPSYWWLLAAE
jgi:dihydroxyacetone kinase-like predicted kinase